MHTTTAMKLNTPTTQMPHILLAITPSRLKTTTMHTTTSHTNLSLLRSKTSTVRPRGNNILTIGKTRSTHALSCSPTRLTVLTPTKSLLRCMKSRWRWK